MKAGDIVTVLQAFDVDKEVEIYQLGGVYRKIWKIETHENPIDKKIHLVFILNNEIHPA